MIDFLRGLPEYKELFYWLLFAAACWAFYRFVNSEDNELEWWHFVSTQNLANGKYYADLDKLGKATGIVIGSWALLTVSANAKSDFTGFAALMGVYFAFVGGIAGYSAYLRAKSGRVETTTTVEPVPRGPTRTTTVSTAPTPTDENPVPVRVVVDNPDEPREPSNDFRR